MTRRRTRFGSVVPPAFVRDAEQDRLLGGKVAPAWLDDRFTPATLLLLRPFRGLVALLALGDATAGPCR